MADISLPVPSSCASEPALCWGTWEGSGDADQPSCCLWVLQGPGKEVSKDVAPCTHAFKHQWEPNLISLAFFILTCDCCSLGRLLMSPNMMQAVILRYSPGWRQPCRKKVAIWTSTYGCLILRPVCSHHMVSGRRRGVRICLFKTLAATRVSTEKCFDPTETCTPTSLW